MNKISDASVEAAGKAISMYLRGSEVAWREDKNTARVAIEAALPHLQPSPAGQGDALVQEALEYFERAGDAGDRKYVSAIRSALAARQPVGQEPVTDFPLTLRGLIAYGQVAGNPSQGAKPSHMRDLIAQMVPHLKRLDAMESAPPAPAADLGQEHVATLTVDDDGMLGWKLTHIGRDLPEGEYRLALIDSSKAVQS